MADSSQYEYPSPLKGDIADDGKSFVNPRDGILSEAYEKFVDPIDNGRRGGFDIHIYFQQSNPSETTFAYALWRRIRYEFPELRIYRLWDRPIGPHPTAMFEVNVFTPREFGAFVSWLVINRGPLSVLVHPNTGDEVRDHTQRATWMGERLTLDLSIFAKLRELRARQAQENFDDA